MLLDINLHLVEAEAIRGEGSQCTSAQIQSLLARHHIEVSMSGVGNCYDKLGHRPRSP